MARGNRGALGQEPLPGAGGARRLRRVERAVSESIRAGRGDAPADARWQATETLARELAAALDLAAATGQPYAVAQLGPRLLEALRELKLTPAVVVLDQDPVTEFLASLQAD